MPFSLFFNQPCRAPQSASDQRSASDDFAHYSTASSSSVSRPGGVNISSKDRAVEATSLNVKIFQSELADVQTSRLLRDQLCSPLLARRLGVRVETLREIGREETKIAGGELDDSEPWEEPVEGHRMLADAASLLQKHVVMGDHSVVAVALCASSARLDRSTAKPSGFPLRAGSANACQLHRWANRARLVPGWHLCRNTQPGRKFYC